MGFRTVLKGIKKSLEGHIVLDCDVELIPTVLKQAKEVNLLDDYHHFIITTLVRINTVLTLLCFTLFVNSVYLLIRNRATSASKFSSL